MPLPSNPLTSSSSNPSSNPQESSQSTNTTSSLPSMPNPISSDPSSDQQQKPGYYASAKGYASNQYTQWKPWLEDQYLAWFGKGDNKASYAAKGQLDKTKVTGISQVDKLQDGVNDLAAGQVGKGGLAQPLGDAVSKEGINRMERGGKDESGNMMPSGVPGQEQAGKVGSGAVEGGKGVVGGIGKGVKGAGGYVGGLWGGGKGEAEGQGKEGGGK
ncbi:MAG: hypothetical protein Q9227_000145 [Pyrenula ochraceoflavens]